MSLDKIIDSTKLNACLTAEANAIRAKSGGSASISFDYSNDKGFADAIAAIPSGSGGGLPSASKNDVTFYDYDGSILYSYTASDFAALTAMPKRPSHTGLTAQGWNWTLSSAKTYVATYGKLNIGQMYITDDGKTRLYISLDDISRPTVTIRFRQSVDNGVTIDWGDGSTPETYTGTLLAADYTHTYSAVGEYVISLAVTRGTLYLEGGASACVMGVTGGTARYNPIRLWKVEIGASVTSIGSYAFSYCYGLTSITIPDSVTSISSYAFYYCNRLTSITIPDSVASITSNAFYYCHGLTSITIPNSVTSISSYALQNCYCLTSVTIPDGVMSISTYAFYNCYGLTSVTIPDSVTSIGGQAFQYCYGMKYYYLKPQTPPTLSNANAFTYIPSDCVMYVPYSADHSILNAYKTASNWSTYASYMQEAAQ